MPLRSQYVIGPRVSSIGEPKPLTFFALAAPASGLPKCAIMIPTTLVSVLGTHRSPDATVTSSSDDEASSRYKRNTALASLTGQATRPAVIVGPTGCARYVNDDTTPKFPPPPRIAQKRSAFSRSLAVM